MSDKRIDSVIENTKEISNKAVLVSVGAYAKAENQLQEQINKLVVAGEKVAGDKASDTTKAVLVAQGAVELLKEEAEKLNNKATEKTNELKEQLSAKTTEAQTKRDEVKAKAIAKRDELTDQLKSKRKEIQDKLTSKRSELKSKSDEQINKLIDEGKSFRAEKADNTPEYLLAGFGAFAKAKQEATKVIDELIEAGEKRRAA